MTTTAAPATPAVGALDSPRGWIVVAATFLSTFTVFGVAYSFGAFFGSMADEFGTSKGATALMFSITTCWYFVFGLVSGKAADRWGPRPVMIVGALCLGAGLLLTAQVDSIWVGYLTYGSLIGTAVACCYVPMVATVGGWFVQRRTAALGVAVAGIGVGTLVAAPLAERLIDRFGWRDAYVWMGVVGTALLLIASLGALRPPLDLDQPPVPLARLTRLTRDRGFLILYLATFLCSLALFVPFVFITDYAEDRGIGSGPAAALVSVIGAASVLGRLGLGALGARFGSIRLMQASFLMLSASFLLWLGAGDRYWMLLAFTVVMGVGYGGFIALAPAAAAGLFGTVGLGGILGALYTAAGVGGLIGPPLAGALIDGISYAAAIVSAMALTAAATVVIFALPD